MKRKPKIEVTDSFLAEQGHTRESYEKLSKTGRWSVRNRTKHYEMEVRWWFKQVPAGIRKMSEQIINDFKEKQHDTRTENRSSL